MNAPEEARWEPFDQEAELSNPRIVHLGQGDTAAAMCRLPSGIYVRTRVYADKVCVDRSDDRIGWREVSVVEVKP